MSCHFQSEILKSDQTMSKYLNVSSKKDFLEKLIIFFSFMFMNKIAVMSFPWVN